jgi:hypothetical protein
MAMPKHYHLGIPIRTIRSSGHGASPSSSSVASMPDGADGGCGRRFKELEVAWAQGQKATYEGVVESMEKARGPLEYCKPHHDLISSGRRLSIGTNRSHTGSHHHDSGLS